jgi:hypothetical protein
MRSYFDEENNSYFFLCLELRPTGEFITIDERHARTNRKEIFPLPPFKREKEEVLRYVVIEVGDNLAFWNPLTSALLFDVNIDYVVRVGKGEDIPDDVYDGFKEHFTNGEDF